MSVKRRSSAPSEPLRWRQVTNLGEQLMRLGQQAYKENQPVHSLLDQQQDLIVRFAEELLESQVSLWFAPPVWQDIFDRSPIEDGGLLPSEFPAQPPTELMRCALQRVQTCAVQSPDTQTFDNPDPTDLETEYHGLAIPLMTHREDNRQPELFGILQATRWDGEPFRLDSFQLLDGLASQVVMALQFNQQAANERWRLTQLSLVRQVSAQIADERDLDELARRVTQLILETFDYYYVTIFTLESEQEELHFRASAGPVQAEPDSRIYSPRLVVKVGEGMIGSVAQSGHEIVAADVVQEKRYLHQDALAETRSEVSLPLMIEDRVLGVLDVQSDQIDDFNETDLLVLRALADSIALAVEGARLYSALQRRADYLAVIHEISNIITSVLERRELLETVVNLIHNRFGYPYVHLFSVHQGRRLVLFEAGSGQGARRLQEQNFSFDLDAPQGFVSWVARHGETILANDASQDPRYLATELPPEETRAVLTIPLIFGDEILGVLDIRSERINAFNDDARFLFETLADHIAVALRNAILYRSEVWRRQVADSMREVAGLLSADAALDKVLDAILLELERSLPLDLAAIWLLDEEIEPDQVGNPQYLYLAAIRGIGVMDLEIDIGLRPEDILAFNPQSLAHRTPEQAIGWLAEVITAGGSLIRTSQAPYEPLGAALNFLNTYSAIAAPLRVGEELLGLLVLADHTTGRYGTEARAMTAAFASYAAIAIENTRLYEAAHDQAWVSTVLLQVSEATQAQDDLTGLLETVLRITPMLSAVKACLVYLQDEDGLFVPTAASGLDPDQQEAFENLRITADQVTALERMMESGYPVVLDNQDDLLLVQILYPNVRESILDVPLLVLAPLLAHGDTFGAFLVDYSSESPIANGRRTIDALFDDQLAIIQGIAHQTAMAIENIRLLRAQKEEAYISVALLQVAQAVVSSNDLDEVLGSIVRITPILVGVERAAIYLWDGERSAFYLSQTYGISRTTQPEQYEPLEFPLLYAVYLQNSLLACPIQACWPAGENAPADWALASVPDMDEVEYFLENEECLVLAFPLSVKDDVLGILVVEEPDSEQTEAFGLNLSNRRLRQKRLEITTGISQQAALAIQNSLLQNEMVERERMEREMQLARQIQTTFLPQSLPDIPGWELQARWRTAREVGGDYYDYFMLPDGRFGLVIADVADKGMPAALFMTLVRTLVRATIQNIEAPEEVLMRVNDILTPDAPDGMFVTLVYAVLCLESGELRYANAGHNLPIVLHPPDRTPKHLKKGGMAMGVMEGASIEGHSITLAPGDYLVMYTDGVTEAFSPEGKLFGDERLFQAVAQAYVPQGNGENPESESALGLLEAIDQSVQDFIAAAPASDDLTLLVLRREENQSQG